MRSFGKLRVKIIKSKKPIYSNKKIINYGYIIVFLYFKRVCGFQPNRIKSNWILKSNLKIFLLKIIIINGLLGKLKKQKKQGNKHTKSSLNLIILHYFFDFPNQSDSLRDIPSPCDNIIYRINNRLWVLLCSSQRTRK